MAVQHHHTHTELPLESASPTEARIGALFLDMNDRSGLEQYLADRGWIQPGITVDHVERAGDGNMNYTLRVVTANQAFILKQARPWVEKYPQIPAPSNRAETEARYYQQIQRHTNLANLMPALLQYDHANRVLMLEDLAGARDMTNLYRDGAESLRDFELGEITGYLTVLHGSFRDSHLAREFANCDMRALNHQHIFVVPLNPDNGLALDSITPGLTSLAKELIANSQYRTKVTALGECYLHSTSHGTLVHGDYFPGSWLRARDRVYVIDPEFCFFGRPEWDIATLTAHLYLAGATDDRVSRAFASYVAFSNFDKQLALQFAGVEIMRRLIGVAQLPLSCSLVDKKALLALAYRLVMN